MMSFMTSALARAPAALVGFLPERAPQLTALGKLQEFGSYTNGWAFGEGEAFSRSVISAATILVTMLQEPIDVFPGRDGDIVVTVYRGQISYDFIVESDSSVTVIKEYEDGTEVSMNFLNAWREVHFAQAVSLYKSVSPTGSSAIKWNLLDSYTRANTNHNVDGLKVQLSSLPALTLGYPVLNGHAPSASLVGSAFTY